MIACQIPGFISEAEGEWLSQKARDGLAIEIGAFEGRSTVYLASAAARVVSCEPFCGQPTPRRKVPGVDFLEVRRQWHLNIHLSGFGNKVTLVEERSAFAYPSLLRRFKHAARLVFVDGEHTESALRTDVCFANLLHIDGIVAFHDYGHKDFPAVKHVVDRWEGQYGEYFQRLPRIGRIQAFRKTHLVHVPRLWAEEAGVDHENSVHSAQFPTSPLAPDSVGKSEPGQWDTE